MEASSNLAVCSDSRNYWMISSFCLVSNEQVLYTRIPPSFNNLYPFFNRPIWRSCRFYSFFWSRNLSSKSSILHSFIFLIVDVYGFALFISYCFYCWSDKHFFSFIWTFVGFFFLFSIGLSFINFFKCLIDP